MLEGMVESERTPVAYLPNARQRWSGAVASFASGLATLTLLPLAICARQEMPVSIAALAGVIVASLMLGAGLRLHLRWLADRVGVTRLRWMLLVLLSWTIA